MSQTTSGPGSGARDGGPGDADRTADAKLLDELDLASPFEPGGDLPATTVDRLRGLDAPTLGQAVVRLVRRAISLPPDQGSTAAASIDRLLEGPRGPIPVQHDVPALVALYASFLADPARGDIARLIARLLRDTPRNEVFATLGMDARSMDVRARLSTDLDVARMEVGPATDTQPERRTRGMHTRGLTHAKPPAPMAPPPQTAARPPTRAMPAPPEPVGAEPGDLEVAAGPGEVATANGGGAPGGTLGGPAGPAVQRTYRAYGLLESDETVLVGRPFDLKLGLAPNSPPGVAGPPIEIPRPDEKPYELEIQLFADGFDFAPGESWKQLLTVSRENLFPTTVVHLTARPTPERRATRSITATFSIDGQTLGAATRQLIVTADPLDVQLMEPAPTTTGTNVTAPTGDPPADVTISITLGVDDGTLQWGVVSRLPGVGLPHDQPVVSRIGTTTQEFATGIVRDMPAREGKKGIFQELIGMGREIADAMPADVWSALAAASAAVPSRPLDVLLLTEEPYVPWEVAVLEEPFDASAPPFLGAQTNIGRWILHGGAAPTDPPRNIDATKIAVVSGVYHSATLARLASAEEEARKIEQLYGATAIDARPDPVYDLLSGVPPVEILHFAVHGQYDPHGAGDGIWLVEGPPINPRAIRGSDLKSRAPFVFLNACQVGNGEELLGSYGGIAQAFLRIGASAVLAPLWSIDDEIAQKIALEFYQQALAPTADATAAGAEAPAQPAAEATPGESAPPAVADILRRARQGLVQDAAAQSSTYIAYQFYGHPSLRLSWHGAEANGGHHGG